MIMSAWEGNEHPATLIILPPVSPRPKYFGFALITVCEEYAVSHEMLFNHKKSVILICRSKYMKNVYPVFTLNGKIVDESDTAR